MTEHMRATPQQETEMQIIRHQVNGHELPLFTIYVPFTEDI